MDFKKRRIWCWFWIHWKSRKNLIRKKVINKTVTEICTFFTLCSSICFAYNFLCVNFYWTFSRDLKSAWIMRFLIPILNIANFKAKRRQNGYKNNEFCKYVLEFNCQPPTPWEAQFGQTVELYLLDTWGQWEGRNTAVKCRWIHHRITLPIAYFGYYSYFLCIWVSKVRKFTR